MRRYMLGCISNVDLVLVLTLFISYLLKTLYIWLIDELILCPKWLTFLQLQWRWRWRRIKLVLGVVWGMDVYDDEGTEIFTWIFNYFIYLWVSLVYFILLFLLLGKIQIWERICPHDHSFLEILLYIHHFWEILWILPQPICTWNGNLIK